MWIYLAILSAVLLGLYDVCKKHSLKENAVLPVLFIATCCGSLPFIPVVLSGGPAIALSPIGHWEIFLKAVLVSSSWVLAFFALKHLPITIAAPIRSSAPVWTLLGATLLFNERLNGLQWIGVTLTFVDYYALAVIGHHEKISFVSNRWIFFIAGGTLLGAASALYDKYLISRYQPVALQAWFYVYLILVLGLVVLIGWVPNRSRYTPFRWRWTIPLIGLFLALADYLYFHALHEKGALIAVISMVRRSSVVVTFLVGARLFRESNLKSKAVALAGLLTGITLIVLA